MRCPDAKRRIDSGSENLDRETIEHLQVCPSCARAAQAARVIRGILGSAGKEDSAPSLTAVRKRVEAQAQVEAEKTTLEKIMSQLNRQFQVRPRLMTGFGLAVIAFLLVTLVPFSYEQAVGYKITIEGAGPDGYRSPEVLAAVLSTAGKEGVSVLSPEDEESNILVLVDIPTEVIAQRVAATLAAAIDDRIKARIEPHIMAVTGSLYAQVRQKITSADPPKVKMQFDDGRIILNGQAIQNALYSTELDDWEIKAELMKAFAAFGVSSDGLEIAVRTDFDEEQRTIKITLAQEYAPEDKDGLVELHIGKKQIWARFDEDATLDTTERRINLARPRDQQDSTDEKPIEMVLPGKSLKGHTIMMTIDL